MAGKPDPYAGIDFEEINEATALEVDEIKCLKTCFDLFDSKKQDFLSADDLDEILRAMGFRPSKEELMDILAEIDEEFRQSNLYLDALWQWEELKEPKMRRQNKLQMRQNHLI